MQQIDIATQRMVEAAVDRCTSEAVSLLQRLVRIPSENRPPTGDEYEVQCAYHDVLQQLGLEAVDIYDPDDLPAFHIHPARLPEREMRGRPNVVGTLRGSGGGKSLLLLAHADVETPGDDSLWLHGTPFSGVCEGGRIYGRGSGDDKSGMMNNAMVVRVLQECGITLQGDLLIASVSDEERGGSNGTAALLAKGYRADACISADGLSQNIAISNLGGGYCELELLVPGPVLDGKELLDYFIELRGHIEGLNRERIADFAGHPQYGMPPFDSRPVKMTNIHLAVDDYTHGTLIVWFYLLPGESAEDFKTRFIQTISKCTLPGSCTLQWLSRFIPASEIEESHPFVHSFSNAYALATSRPPRITGSPMGDMGFINHYGKIPCLGHGISRWDEEGMAHQPNEYIEVEKIVEYLKTTVFCVLDWCGYSRS